MNFEEAKRVLADCKRDELRDHSFMDREVFWMRGNVEVATGYFGPARDGGHGYRSVAIDEQGKLSHFNGEEAAELVKLGKQGEIRRNDSTGPDEYGGE